MNLAAIGAVEFSGELQDERFGVDSGSVDGVHDQFGKTGHGKDRRGASDNDRNGALHLTGEFTPRFQELFHQDRHQPVLFGQGHKTTLGDSSVSLMLPVRFDQASDEVAFLSVSDGTIEVEEAVFQEAAFQICGKIGSSLFLLLETVAVDMVLVPAFRFRLGEGSVGIL